MANGLANQFGINYGNILATAENIKTARANRIAAEAEQRMGQQKLDAIAARDPEALLALGDAKSALTLLNYLEKADKTSIDRTRRQSEMLGQAAAIVLQSPNPEETYQMVLQHLPADMRAQAPDTYDPNFVRLIAAQSLKVKDILDNPEAFGGKPKAKDTATDIKAADENAIYKYAAQLYGGFYDPATGQFSGLDADKATKIQSIATEAVRLMRAEGLDRHEAVTKAARKAKIDIPDLNAPPSAADPASIRNYFGLTQ